jgi:hypothetical protein
LQNLTKDGNPSREYLKIIMQLLKHLSTRWRKLKLTLTKPLELKRYSINFVSALFAGSYENGMLAIDRVTSLVFAFIYDLFDVMRENETHAVDVLFFRYKYSVGTDQESLEKFALEDTLLSYAGDRLKTSVYYWDVNRPLLGFGISFYMKAVSLNPKHIVLSSYAPDVFYQPMPWLLARLKRKKIRLVTLWWDTCNSTFLRSISSVIKCVDVHGIMDNPTLNFGEEAGAQLLKQKAICLFSAFDLDLEERQRDIDVAFLGQTSAYRSVRKAYLDFLLENKVPLHYSAYEKNQQCTHEKYYEILSRSKIGINFSMSVDVHQLKARVFETMLAGGLLLEERNDQTAYYFTEDVEYVAFSTQDELLEKINYYLAHEDERRKIAEAGFRRVKRLFGGRQFWKIVLNQ